MLKPVCVIFEWARLPRHFLLGEGHPIKKLQISTVAFARAPRQWPGGMEAITCVFPFMKYMYRACMLSLHSLHCNFCHIQLSPFSLIWKFFTGVCFMVWCNSWCAMNSVSRFLNLNFIVNFVIMLYVPNLHCCFTVECLSATLFFVIATIIMHQVYLWQYLCLKWGLLKTFWGHVKPRVAWLSFTEMAEIISEVWFKHSVAIYWGAPFS